MMRALKIAFLVMLLAAVSLVATLGWLVRSEQGSAWLLEQGLRRAPVTIEVSGVGGTLAEGLAVKSLRIKLPVADVHAQEIVVRWSPSALLAGIVQIDDASIAELSIDVLQSAEAGDPAEDRLFWLAFPLHISIESGRVDGLRIEAAEFTNLHIAGGIGHGRLEVETLVAQIANTDIQVSGELTGPAPGHLQASGSWELPAASLSGTAQFSGDIDKLAVTHILNMPDPLNFDGHIYDLFTGPTLAGVAEWSAIQLPGAAVLHSNAGKATVTSNFREASVEGDSTLVLAGWPEALLHMEAVADLQGIRIDNFELNALDGQVTGSGQIDYTEGLRGQLQIRAARINAGLINENIAGSLGFESTLLIESTDALSIIIDNYDLQAFGGALAGAGRIRYAKGLSGQLQISGARIDTGRINAAIPGQLAFSSVVQIESADVFTVDVAEARALIAGNEIAGEGRVQWRDGQMSAIKADIVAGMNHIEGDVAFGTQLAGTVSARLPELAKLWPELDGSLNADIRLGGSLENPQVRLSADAAALSYASQSLDTLSVAGDIQTNGTLSGNLSATGLLTGDQALGDLSFEMAGTLAEFQTRLELAGSVVNAELRAEGGWDGTYLAQRFTYGWVEPVGFESWRLEQSPLLRVSAAAGQLGAHCWKQAAAGICLQSGNWDSSRQQIAVLVDSFALATLLPLLADGYRIDGTVDAAVSVVRSSEGLRGEAHWRQSRTILAYADGIDEFQTELDEVQIDITSTDERTDFSASLGGEAGLTLTAAAAVQGPLAEASPVVASANGSLPSIGLLRPFVQRVVQPAELQGELTINLNVGGTLGDPVFTGGAYLADGVLGLVDTGITLTDIVIAAESVSSDSLKLTGRFRSGDGQAELNGNIRSQDNADGDLGLVADIRIDGENLAIVRSPDLNVDASPDLRLSVGEGVFDISGRINIPYARAQVRELPRNAATRSADVVVHTSEPAAAQTDSGTILTGDVEVILGDDVRFNGFGLDSRLEGSLRLTQKRGGFLRSAGTVRVRDGFLTGYGKELRVDRGDLTFAGPLDDPLINVQVSRESVFEGRQYTIGLRLTGSAQNVKTEPFSRPAMSDNDVLAFLLIDRPAGTGADASGAAVAMGLGQLVPGDGGGLLGLDEVGFETNEANQAAMVAGKRINDDIFVRYVFGALGEPGAFRIRYRLGKGFSLEASTGSAQSLDIIYMLER